jgi:hypothetical protein
VLVWLSVLRGMLWSIGEATIEVSVCTTVTGMRSGLLSPTESVAMTENMYVPASENAAVIVSVVTPADSPVETVPPSITTLAPVGADWSDQITVSGPPIVEPEGSYG